MRRGIRSYVLRQGRTTPAQQRALDELFTTYGIPYRQALLEPRAGPLVLEIGSGMGESTARIAAQRPETDFIAVEVHGPGVGSLLQRIDKQGLKNLRVIRHDAVEVLEHMIADGALAGLHLFFPDPWPKKRHHKRRLVQPAFAALAARKLAPGGYLHAATDWSHYAAQIEAVLDAEPLLARAVEPRARPLTKFEQRGVKLGHEVRDLVYWRR
ncbi:MAG: tRNA (guanosine(46)-N7)-methyltransferase TrmB [Geminicoccales bacterium]